MYSIRTDLAMERDELYRSENKLEKTEGVSVETDENDGIKVTRVCIENEEGERNLNKPVGHYVTIETPQLTEDTEAYEKTCGMVADEIKKLCDGTEDKTTLVIGLGNRAITPDALGTSAVEKVMITRHVKSYMPDALREGVESVCAVAPGVLGTTGIESADIIKAVTEKVNPDCVIVIDALAAADFKRLGTTIQICDTGIQPGAGVGNNRNEINKETLGCPVIAVGMPMVIDARTVMNDEQREDERTEPLIVTPRNIDLLTERAAKTVANGINLALHKNVTIPEIEEYVG